MNNKQQCSCHFYSSGNSNGFRSSVPETKDKDQIYIFSVPQVAIVIVSKYYSFPSRHVVDFTFLLLLLGWPCDLL